MTEEQENGVLASEFKSLLGEKNSLLVWMESQKTEKEIEEERKRCVFKFSGLIVDVVSVSKQSGGLIHLDGLAAFAHWFTLVGKSLMAAELSGLCEAAVATLALERLLPGVRANVVVERRGTSERTSAVSTLEGSVARVRHHVVPQI